MSSDEKQQRVLQIRSSLAWNLFKPGLKTAQQILKFDNIYRALLGCWGWESAQAIPKKSILSYSHHENVVGGERVCVCVCTCVSGEGSVAAGRYRGWEGGSCPYDVLHDLTTACHSETPTRRLQPVSVLPVPPRFSHALTP